MTPEAKKYWDEKMGNKRTTIEEWLSKATPGKAEKSVIKTLHER